SIVYTITVTANNALVGTASATISGATLAETGLDTVYASLAAQVDGFGGGFFANKATRSLIVDNTDPAKTFTLQVTQRATFDLTAGPAGTTGTVVPVVADGSQNITLGTLVQGSLYNILIDGTPAASRTITGTGDLESLQAQIDALAGFSATLAGGVIHVDREDSLNSTPFELLVTRQDAQTNITTGSVRATDVRHLI